MVRSLVVLVGCVLMLSCHFQPRSAPKIIGGVKNSDGYPFFVGLVNEGAKESFCGASLIAQDVVLTAAHCVEHQVDNLTVVIGLKRNEISPDTPARKVKAIKIHPQYGQVGYAFDLALLFLEPQLAAASLAAPITLNRDVTLPAVADKARVIGHGNMSSYGQLFGPDLYEVDVPVVPYDVCRLTYPELQSDQICAGIQDLGGKDSCQGDSGGPLFLPGETPSLVGIVSYGDGCAQKQKAGVYTRVASFIDWIEESIATYRQPTGGLTLQNIEEQINLYCYRQVRLIDNLSASPVEKVEFQKSLGSAQNWQPLASQSELAITLQQAKQMEFARCDAKTLDGHAFSVVYAKSLAQQASAIESTAYLNLAGQWYAAKPPVKESNYIFACMLNEEKPFWVGYNDRDDFPIVNHEGFYLGRAIASEPSRYSQLAMCAMGGYEARVMLGDDKTRYLRLQFGQQAGVKWYKMLENQDGFVKLKLRTLEERRGVLEISNPSTTDLFSWRLSCPFAFSLSRNGQIWAGQKSKFDTYDVEFITSDSPVGEILAQSAQDFVIETPELTMADLSRQVCVFNGVSTSFELIVQQ